MEEEKISKLKRLITNLIALALIPISLLPIASAYTAGPLIDMLSFWDIFVVNLFGSFWPAILFIAMIFFLILMLAGISLYTVIIFLMYFIAAMSIGYGYAIIVWPILFFSITYFLWQFIKLIFENR